jgi:hypothetical protein
MSCATLLLLNMGVRDGLWFSLRGFVSVAGVISCVGKPLSFRFFEPHSETSLE